MKVHRLAVRVFVFLFIVTVAFACDRNAESVQYVNSQPYAGKLYNQIYRDSHFKCALKCIRLASNGDFETVIKQANNMDVYLPDDSTFNAFFENNNYHVKRVEDFTHTELSLMVKYYMLPYARDRFLFSHNPILNSSAGLDFRKSMDNYFIKQFVEVNRLCWDYYYILRRTDEDRASFYNSFGAKFKRTISVGRGSHVYVLNQVILPLSGLVNENIQDKLSPNSFFVCYRNDLL